MGKLLVLIVVLGGLYFIGTNYQSIDLEQTKDAVIHNLETKGVVGAVRNGRMQRKKEILDATSF